MLKSRSMLDSAGDFIAVYDPEMRLITFNASFERIMRQLAGRDIVPACASSITFNR